MAKVSVTKSRNHLRRFDGLRFEPRYAILVVVSIAVVYLVAVPVGTLIVASLRSSFISKGSSHWTFDNYSAVFESPSLLRIALNSLLFALPTAVLSTIVGFGLAWLVTRTNTPARAFTTAVAVLPLLLPGILNTVAWTLLLSPAVGPVNSVFHAAGFPVFNIYSIPGMVFAQSMHAAPLAFLLGTAAFTTMDSSLEEAALASGATPGRVFRRITLRMVRLALISAMLLIFIQAISSFEVPELIGTQAHIFVFVTYIYTALLHAPPNYGVVGVIGTFVLAICVVGLLASQRFGRNKATQTISGKGFRSSPQDIGRWRWLALGIFVVFFFVDAVLPLAMLVWSSLLPGYEAPSLNALRHLSFANYVQIARVPSVVLSIKNSLITAVSSGIIVVLVSVIVSYLLVKTRTRGRSFLDALVTSPIAVPSIVLGVGILYFYIAAPLPVRLYGALAILVVAFVTIGLPYGVRYIVPGFAQIKDELEEAAMASGASWIQTLRRIYVPLLMPSLIGAFIYAMIIAFREISAAIFLYSQQTVLLSVQIFQLWSVGNFGVAAALGVVLVAILALLGTVASVLRRMSKRTGAGKYASN